MKLSTFISTWMAQWLTIDPPLLEARVQIQTRTTVKKNSFEKAARKASPYPSYPQLVHKKIMDQSALSMLEEMEEMKRLRSLQQN